jgi:hypothetical protein
VRRQWFPWRLRARKIDDAGFDPFSVVGGDDPAGFLVSLALAAVDLDKVGAFLPTNASSALMSPGNAFLDYLQWWAGGVVLLGYAVALALLGVVLSVRRDVT